MEGDEREIKGGVAYVNETWGQEQVMFTKKQT
jgi:hypothetical protein